MGLEPSFLNWFVVFVDLLLVTFIGAVMIYWVRGGK